MLEDHIAADGLEPANLAIAIANAPVVFPGARRRILPVNRPPEPRPLEVPPPNRKCKMISLRLSAQEYAALHTLYPNYGARNVSDFARLAMHLVIAQPLPAAGPSLAEIPEFGRRLPALQQPGDSPSFLSASHPDHRRKMISLRVTDMEYDLLKAHYRTYGARNISELARLALQRIMASAGSPKDFAAQLSDLEQRLHQLESHVSLLLEREKAAS